MPGWANDAVRRLDGVHDLPGAQREQPHAVLQRLLHDEPLEHRPAPRRRRPASARRGAPTRSAIPTPGGSRDQFFNQAAYALPAPGTLGNAKKGSLRGPGTWVVNFAFYKDLVARNSFRLQFSALLDNAFNHPQFFVSAIEAPDSRTSVVF